MWRYLLMVFVVVSPEIASCEDPEGDTWRRIACGFGSPFGAVGQSARGIRTFAISPETALNCPPLSSDPASHTDWKYDRRRVKNMLRIKHATNEQAEMLSLLAQIWTAESLVDTLNVFGVQFLSPEVGEVMRSDPAFYGHLVQVMRQLDAQIGRGGLGELATVAQHERQSWLEGVLQGMIENALVNMQQRYQSRMISSQLVRTIAQHRAVGMRLVAEKLREQPMRSELASQDVEIAFASGRGAPQNCLMVTNVSETPLPFVLIVVENHSLRSGLAFHYTENWRPGHGFYIGAGPLRIRPSNKRRAIPLSVLIADAHGSAVGSDLIQRCGTRFHQHFPYRLTKILLDPFRALELGQRTPVGIGQVRLDAMIKDAEKQIKRVSKQILTELRKSREETEQKRLVAELTDLTTGTFPSRLQTRESERLSIRMQKLEEELRKIDGLEPTQAKEIVASSRAMYGSFLRSP